ncbi:MFS transporter [Streptomyces capitiformicae]|uniref:MFS transporter n=1 Tax=Streptomyces capitiformicae TaxID=2014920 RepID=A0A919D9H8_9ACTN|nr:MFS transporter [Streptomyces capitiformicae]GHE29444.1 MFS transporter [Streptomyces capitiformicae]
MGGSRGLLRGPLSGHRNFRLFLLGFAASKTGSQVTLLALPLVAALELDASPFHLGVITAVETGAMLIAGLPAGVWVDKVRRLPLLVQTDVLRCVVIGSLPVAAAVDRLTLAHLYLAAAITGAATVVSDIASQSFLPALLPRDRLIAGNGAVATVQSSAEVVGPGIGGGLVQAMGAPLALLADAISYLVSAVLLLGIRFREAVPTPTDDRSLGRDIVKGVRFVFGHPLLRVIAITTGLSNLFTAFLLAVQIAFWTQVLRLSPLEIGLVLSASAVGGLAGALLAQRLAGRFGQVPLILLSVATTSPFAILWPLSSGPLAPYMFALGLAVVWFGAVVYNVAQLTFRQLVCPDELLGRMNATMRFVALGVMPLGALVGGALASAWGPRAALWVCAAGFLSLPPLLLLSPFRSRANRSAEQHTPVSPGTPPETTAAQDPEHGEARPT